jgi:hypothetical protein
MPALAHKFKTANCIIINLNENESLHHRENLIQMGAPKTPILRRLPG